jgi:sarcosine oxidase subunit beta
MAGLRIPITPRRGQLIVTRACPKVIGGCLLSAGYIAAKYQPGPASAEGHGVSIEQTENGNLLLGSTREFAGFDRRTTPEGLRHIAARTARILPALKTVSVIRAFAGLRPYTPDGLPILGRVSGIEGLYMAAGHEGDGIALSAITGKLIAQLIDEGRTDLPLDAFRLERFSPQGRPGGGPARETKQDIPWTT